MTIDGLGDVRKTPAKVLGKPTSLDDLTSEQNNGTIKLQDYYHTGLISTLKEKIKKKFTNPKYLEVSKEYLDSLPKKEGNTLSDLYTDLMETNPQFYTSDGIEYHWNCQRCVPTYEMRKRGYNVTAKPSFKDDTLGDWEFRKIFIDMKWIVCHDGSGIDDIKNYMSKWGDGARAEISIKTDKGSHLFIAEQRDRTTYFVDPQAYKNNAEDYFNYNIIAHTEICRIDNLRISELIRECCEGVT